MFGSFRPTDIQQCLRIGRENGFSFFFFFRGGEKRV